MLLVGLAAATALFSGVQAINFQARASYAAASAQLGGDQFAFFALPDRSRFSDAAFVRLRLAGWPVSPMLEGRAVVGERAYRVIGVDVATLPPAANVLDFDGQGDLQGPGPMDFMTPPHAALASASTIAALDGAEATDRGAPLPRRIAADGVAANTLVMDIGAAQALLDARGEISRLVIGEVDETRLPPIDTVVDERFERVAPGSEADAARLADSFHLNLTAFGLLSFFVSLLIVHAAVGLAFEQRLATFRTLRASGVSARALMAGLVIELVGAALLAGVVGLVLGFAIAAGLLPNVALTLRGLYGAPVDGALAVRLEWIALGLAISVAGAFAAAAGRLVKTRTMSVLAPALPEAWRAAEATSLKRNAGVAAALLLVAATLLLLGGGLLAGFALMGATLVASALALPVLLSAVARLGEAAARHRGPVAQWFWADARQQLPSLSIALQALLVALAVNIGVGAMVGSFRETFLGFLDQRLVAELYVDARDGDEAAKIRAWLEARPEATRTLPLAFLQARARVADERVRVRTVGVADDATYRDHWPMLAAAPGAWSALARGEAVFVNEQTYRGDGVGVGDEISFATPSGEWRLPIAGIFSDYGNPMRSAMVNVDALRARWPTTDGSVFVVRADDDAADALETALREAFALDERQLVNQRYLKELSKSIFERTFAVTGALNVLTLGVAGVALLTSLVSLGEARRPQLAPLWAMGLTRARLARLDLVKTLALALLTAVLATPLGLAIAWMLTAIVNVEAFGWKLPVYPYPMQWLTLAALAVAIAGLAAAPAAIALRRTPPARLLRIFADER